MSQKPDLPSKRMRVENTGSSSAPRQISQPSLQSQRQFHHPYHVSYGQTQPTFYAPQSYTPQIPQGQITQPITSQYLPTIPPELNSFPRLQAATPTKSGKRNATEMDMEIFDSVAAPSNLSSASLSLQDIMGVPQPHPERSHENNPGTTQRQAKTEASISSPPIPGSAQAPAKRARTNTPWTAPEEQRLKRMREAGNTWAEIAATFSNRTEGSVKKHWYKDMHFSDFGTDEKQALLVAVHEFEASRWKVVGLKVGKPAKACEAFWKEHLAGS